MFLAFPGCLNRYFWQTILKSRQPREKLQCLYKDLMSTISVKLGIDLLKFMEEKQRNIVAAKSFFPKYWFESKCFSKSYQTKC